MERFDKPNIDLQNISDIIYKPFEPFGKYEEIKRFCVSNRNFIRPQFPEFYTKYSVDFSLADHKEDLSLLNISITAIVKDITTEDNIALSIDFVGIRTSKYIADRVNEAKKIGELREKIPVNRRPPAADFDDLLARVKDFGQESAQIIFYYDTEPHFDLYLNGILAENIDKGNKIIMNLYILPIIYGIVLMHCKNVKLIEEPKASLKRMLNKHKKNPETIYKIIDILPFRKLLKQETDEELEKTGIHKALHICRGHLRTYDELKPLFGKYSGTYFVPAHLRGKQINGVVSKDYNVEKPR